MKIRGLALIILGTLGAVFVSTYDIIAGKPVNDVTGPKSILAFVICGIFIVLGTRFLFKKKKIRS